MRVPHLPLFAALGLFVATFSGTSDGPASQDGPALRDEKIVTLYAADDLRSSFSFRTGQYGGRIEDAELHLEGAQVVFHRLAPSRLTLGFGRRERASILDLGPSVIPPDPQLLDDAPKPPISIFHTLFQDGGDLAVRHPDHRKVTLGPYHEFLNGHIPDEATDIVPQVGSVYVLRFKDRAGEQRYEGVVKFQVLEFVPDQRLTFRWAAL